MTRLACRMRLAMGVVAVLAGCDSTQVTSPLGGGSGGGPGDGGGTGGPMGGGGSVSPPVIVDGCPELFTPDTLRAYALDIAPDQWAAMTADFMNVQAVLAGNPPESYRPAVFHYGDETFPNATVRLKGQSSWVDTVMYDANPKMQFVVAFDQIDPTGSFHGVSKIDFDMPRADYSFLNERIANSWFRKIGIMAPCASSGTMTINGNFYGLYVTEQTKSGKLLQQFFPGNSDGDFLKGGSMPNGNTPPNMVRMSQFWGAHDLSALSQIVDLPHSLLEWASEALLNDSDGYYGGSHNFYLYDQGAAGYVFLPTDKDSSLEWMTLFDYRVNIHQHPVYWWQGRTFPQQPGQHWMIVMSDPAGRKQYVDALETQLAKWDVAELQDWIETWSQQIAAAVDQDPHKWATTDQFHQAISAAHDMVTERPAFVTSFIQCARGMPADDKDGDGVPWCNDCADTRADMHPGAAEVCGDGVDNNCDGVVDENCPGETPTWPGQNGRAP
jgi:hypothetical protein